MKRQDPVQPHPTQSHSLAIDWDSGAFSEGQEPYDATDPTSIEAWGRKMEGQTFGTICEAAIEHGYDADLFEKAMASQGKGGLGLLVEYYHFGYMPNSVAAPDFPDADVELKTTPYRMTEHGDIAAKERLVVTMIDYFNVLRELDFYHSQFWHKAHRMLLVWYEWKQDAAKRDYSIQRVFLFSPPRQDLPTIEKDWSWIRQQIDAGLAHQITCAGTDYVEACPKAANSSVLRKQPHSILPAKPRAYAFKVSYMTVVINRELHRKKTAETIVPEGTSAVFEEWVQQTIAQNVGLSDAELFQQFGMDSAAKNRHSLLVYRMLGVKGDKAEEFIKAGIVVKTIRLKPSGTPKEDMSFPAFRFLDVAEEEWETADIAERFRHTRFLFVAFKEGRDGILRLRGCVFWAMPYHDLEEEYRRVWQKAKDTILSGEVAWVDSTGKRHTAFPKKTESPVGHVRPHGRNAADVDVLPNGTTFTRQCFWLNGDYIRKQLGRQLTEG